MNCRFDQTSPPQIVKGDPLGSPFCWTSHVDDVLPGHDVEMKQLTSMVAFPTISRWRAPSRSVMGRRALSARPIRWGFHLPPEPPLAGALWQGARAAVRPPPFTRTCAGG